MKLIATVFCIACAFACGPVMAGEPHACDLTAGHPSDPDKVGAGVPTAEVVTHVAIPACRDALAAEPENARYNYQLGRAIVYWAGANGADRSEGEALVAKAAELGHTQAQFVYGLLLSGDAARVCDVERWTRLAADKGLKAARVGYVNDALAGRFADCSVATTKEMGAYLDGAATQVSGYYERMLLATLRRLLAASET